MNETYWLFNTDETEVEGEGAHLEMIAQSRIAAWGGFGYKPLISDETGPKSL